MPTDKKNLSHVLQRENNNLDLIRLIASVMVIVGHAFTIHPTNNFTDPLFSFSKVGYLGSTAVSIFFFLSGILITKSYMTSNNWVKYCFMRFFRIWPAYLVCLITTVLIVGTAYTTLPILTYLTTKATWKFFIGNATMLHMSYGLPDVFSTLHFPATVNISIWTLPYEVLCYIAVLIIGALGFFENANSLQKFGIFLLVLLFAASITGLNVLGSNSNLFVFFSMGAFCALNSNHILISWKIFCSLIACYLFSIGNDYSFLLFYPTVFYGAIYCASTKLICLIKLHGDYSYGTYLYGFITQQIIAYHFPQMTTYESLLISIPSSILLGYFSWNYIEAPSLIIGRKLSSKPYKKLFQKLLQKEQPA